MTHWQLMFRLMLALISTCAVDVSMGEPLRPPQSRDWLGRPWEIRYVLFAAELNSITDGARLARNGNATHGKRGRENVYFLAEEMFEPTATFTVPGSESLAVVLINFDRRGHVADKNTRLSPFTAKINMLDVLVLTKDGSQKEKPYDLADWSQGIPGDVSFSPAVCTVIDVLRYEDGWDKDDSYHGSFGCREWTDQLYDRAQPYIDVTSCAKHGSFIGKFVGWSRFSDPPKPIIGLQGKTWLCLHDCPTGEKPGVIPSIKRWAERHHFPVPVPPPRQPLYPNSNYKDDLSE
jgi:hypothetical protein